MSQRALATGVSLTYHPHGPFYPPQSDPTVNRPFLLFCRRRFSPPRSPDTHDHVTRFGRHFVNVSLQIHGQIPLSLPHSLSRVAGLRVQPGTNNPILHSDFLPSAAQPLLTPPAAPPLPPALDLSTDTDRWNCKCLPSNQGGGGGGDGGVYGSEGAQRSPVRDITVARR